MVEDTRLRIVEATLQLHTTKGPARTSMQDIARLADVSLVTAYRHFPELKDLFGACKTRFLQKYPPPGPEVLEGCHGLDQRVGTTIMELYRYYEVIGQALWAMQRDVEVLPEFKAVFQEGMGSVIALAEAALAPLASNGKSYQKALAILTVAIDVGTWRNLVRLQGFNSEQASELMTDLVLGVAGVNKSTASSPRR
jgi:AcrR family transcriptional regulator